MTIHDNALVTVYQFPGGVKNKFYDTRLLVKQDLFHVVPRSVVILMYAGKVKNNRNAHFREIVVIRTIVKTVRIFRVIERIIQLVIDGFFVRVLANLMQKIRQ